MLHGYFVSSFCTYTFGRINGKRENLLFLFTIFHPLPSHYVFLLLCFISYDHHDFYNNNNAVSLLYFLKNIVKRLPLLILNIVSFWRAVTTTVGNIACKLFKIRLTPLIAIRRHIDTQNICIYILYII